MTVTVTDRQRRKTRRARSLRPFARATCFCLGTSHKSAAYPPKKQSDACDVSHNGEPFGDGTLKRNQRAHSFFFFFPRSNGSRDLLWAGPSGPLYTTSSGISPKDKKEPAEQQSLERRTPRWFCLVHETVDSPNVLLLIGLGSVIEANQKGCLQTRLVSLFVEASQSGFLHGFPL